jgi:16S rRNA (guanine527-N7)-methyltransferase
VSPGGTSRFPQTDADADADADEHVRRWIDALIATPGLTAIAEIGEARRVHLEQSLAALPLVRRFDGPLVDVGSGGGAPGIPLAHALPEREVALLEANGRKCEFLRQWAPLNARVIHGRAEEQEVDRYGVAVAKALASPPVAAEWCLPLVRPGGGVVLWVGPSASLERVEAVAARLAAEPLHAPAGFVVLHKLGPTPAGFPRRPGIARKRPLA